MDQTYLSLAQAAELAGVSYAALRREISRGRLEALRVGRKYFVTAEAAEAWRQLHRAPEGRTYTVRQVMEILPLSYAYIIGLIRSGRLPAVKQGRQYLISHSDLDKFLKNAKKECEVRSSKGTPSADKAGKRHQEPTRRYSQKE